MNEHRGRKRSSATVVLGLGLALILIPRTALAEQTAGAGIPMLSRQPLRSRPWTSCSSPSWSSRGLEVRMVLLLASIPLFAAKGGLPAMIAKVAGEMANPQTVVPISSAMGFAFVLRLTGCDQHLVQLLVAPIRHVRWLLVPGGIVAGYLINTTIVSQAGTASVLGPILIPLLRSGGLGAAQAGAVLLLGSSMGGELFNSGAVEMRKLAELTGLDGAQLVARSAALNLSACSAALLTFWLLALRRIRRADDSGGEGIIEGETTTPAFRMSPVKAIVPVIPLAILFADHLLGPARPWPRSSGRPGSWLPC